MKIRTVFILILLLLLVGFGVWAGYQWGYEPPPPPEIRTEIVDRMVEVEVVKRIEVEVPGPERVIERVVWRTRDVEVPGETIELIRQIPVAERVFGRIVIDAEKYEGTVDGRLTRGWIGTADCQVRSDSVDWYSVVAEPFDRTLSFSESTDEPGTPEERATPWRVEGRFGLTTAPGLEGGLSWYRRGRLGWFASVRYDLDPATYSEFVSQYETFETIEADRWQIGAGVAFAIGRK